MPDRPAIPRGMQRALSEEAGYRCAIPQCRGTSALEYAHIKPWAEVREHTFDNLIVLCAVDHARYDKGEIPRASIVAFKHNLDVLSHRYSEVENRLLTAFAQEDAAEPLAEVEVPVPGAMRFMLKFLVDDGIIEFRHEGEIPTVGGVPMQDWVGLTEKGATLVSRIRAGAEVS